MRCCFGRATSPRPSAALSFSFSLALAHNTGDERRVAKREGKQRSLWSQLWCQATCCAAPATGSARSFVRPLARSLVLLKYRPSFGRTHFASSLARWLTSLVLQIKRQHTRTTQCGRKNKILLLAPKRRGIRSLARQVATKIIASNLSTAQVNNIIIIQSPSPLFYIHTHIFSKNETEALVRRHSLSQD